MDLDLEKELVPLKGLLRGRTIICPSVKLWSLGIDLELDKSESLSRRFSGPDDHLPLNYLMFPGNRSRCGEERVRFKALFRGKGIIFPSISLCSWGMDLDLEEEGGVFKGLFRPWTIIFPSIGLDSRGFEARSASCRRIQQSKAERKLRVSEAGWLQFQTKLTSAL
jgi:metallophosphoesterase superfamily enzyme